MGVRSTAARPVRTGCRFLGPRAVSDGGKEHAYAALLLTPRGQASTCFCLGGPPRSFSREELLHEALHELLEAIEQALHCLRQYGSLDRDTVRRTLTDLGVYDEEQQVDENLRLWQRLVAVAGDVEAIADELDARHRQMHRDEDLPLRDDSAQEVSA